MEMSDYEKSDRASILFPKILEETFRAADLAQKITALTARGNLRRTGALAEASALAGISGSKARR
jgi:hypothetical protein